MRFMKNTKIYACLLSMMLIVAMAFTTVGCNSKKDSSMDEKTAVVAETVEKEIQVLGEGKTMFLFTVVDKEGNETNFEIHTDKETVGDALLDLELISGDDGEFGLYVKTVNGITADYNVDQTYWAFYVDGEYAMSGVDTTTIEDGKTYAFKVEK